jgi:hypothetical protein
MPTIEIPAPMFNALLCGLITAACWHFVNCAATVYKRVRNTDEAR